MQENQLRHRKWRMTKVFLEALSVSASWILFFFYRKLAIDGLAFHEGLSSFQDKNLYFGILANGILWIIVSFITGRYDKVFVEGRLAKLVNLLAATLLSSLVLYFVLFIDDGISTPSDYYHILLAYACLQLILVSLSNGVFRMLLTIQFSQDKYHTIVHNIGGIQEEINSRRERGILYRNATTEVFNSVEWKNEIHGPSQVWRVFEPMDLKDLNVEQINALVKNQVELRLYHRSSENHPFRQSMDYSLGRYYCAPLTSYLSGWQKANKRAMDISLSLLGLLLGIPLFVLCIVGVKSTSKGPILYTQERIGLHKKPFRIYKFRSMIIDAEKDGPQLSSEKDHRITSWGHSMRKWRLDELPQLWNCLLYTSDAADE